MKDSMIHKVMSEMGPERRQDRGPREAWKPWRQRTARPAPRRPRRQVRRCGARRRSGGESISVKNTRVWRERRMRPWPGWFAPRINSMDSSQLDQAFPAKLLLHGHASGTPLMRHRQTI